MTSNLYSKLRELEVIIQLVDDKLDIVVSRVNWITGSSGVVNSANNIEI